MAGLVLCAGRGHCVYSMNTVLRPAVQFRAPMCVCCCCVLFVCLFFFSINEMWHSCTAGIWDHEIKLDSGLQPCEAAEWLIEVAVTNELMEYLDYVAGYTYSTCRNLVSGSKVPSLCYVFSSAI